MLLVRLRLVAERRLAMQVKRVISQWNYEPRGKDLRLTAARVGGDTGCVFRGARIKCRSCGWAAGVFVLFWGRYLPRRLA